MLYPPMSKLLENVSSRYLLVNVVARRARQVSIEAQNMGEPLDDKPVSIAIDEVAEGRLTAGIKDEYLEAGGYHTSKSEASCEASETEDETDYQPMESEEFEAVEILDEE